ncbi:hypothetical protein JTE90_019543 [Oedothorax gibbosus]|uniref:Uncharacterized protein n=1 Tax=Oedothorax gibbosus TaxID=931172 RepID=A0AAV6U7E7_9ARAC|nr:hypothetical protein JTE90_019543 [Oedothorax gibbosus]
MKATAPLLPSKLSPDGTRKPLSNFGRESKCDRLAICERPPKKGIRQNLKISPPAISKAHVTRLKNHRGKSRRKIRKNGRRGYLQECPFICGVLEISLMENSRGHLHLLDPGIPKKVPFPIPEMRPF